MRIDANNSPKGWIPLEMWFITGDAAERQEDLGIAPKEEDEFTKINLINLSTIQCIDQYPNYCILYMTGGQEVKTNHTLMELIAYIEIDRLKP